MGRKWIVLMVFQIMITPAFPWDHQTDSRLGRKDGPLDISAHITTGDLVRQMAAHPAFEGFGKCLLPWDQGQNEEDLPLSRVSDLLPYHSHVNPDVVVASINHMIDMVNQGKKLFYRFYTEQERQADPAKAMTGLFFFRGQPGAPFAVICPGGGFAYVGSLHEGFPHAVALSQRGYNAFVLRYRTGSGFSASQDLAAALSFIYRNRDGFQVSPDRYSIWGSSAGARMAGDIASSGSDGFGGHDFPGPGAVIIAYTGHDRVSEHYPPTFIMVSEDDGIVHVPTVDRRVEKLRRAGVTVEYRKYKHAGHGFGLGIGTDAEGWLEHAVRFWESH